MNAASETPQVRVSHLFEDPRAQSIASVYATAFLDSAASTGDTAGLVEELVSFVDEVLVGSPDFRELLFSGMVSREEKIAVIDRVVAPRASQTFSNFLRVLAEHDRLDLLSEVVSQVCLEHERRQGRGRVELKSARPLSAETLESIRRELGSALKFDPILIPEVDPSLIGGIVIRVGDTVYDSSLRTRLKNLRDRMRERSLHEIQSGRDRFCHSEGN